MTRGVGTPLTLRVSVRVSVDGATSAKRTRSPRRAGCPLPPLRRPNRGYSLVPHRKISPTSPLPPEPLSIAAQRRQGCSADSHIKATRLGNESGR
eukprot:117515-Chlamydomonas_euryale.AAC.3